ncbi:YifB family Mg chelatase-like AAA ATPase [Longispora sp. K20-0274]|uniref:YifB family Mg chelatase-like AAA ATPase n=1 Tax=Longispora sp. K20-0274 TaxID=3088255 RepID=UPI00399A5274
MGYARVHAVGLSGVRGTVVEVEADVRAGLPGLLLTGLPDTALHQARDRVRAAIVNCGEEWPSRYAVVNLLPASQPKAGSGFDLAIAMALLCAHGALPAAVLADTVFIGELGLDGQVRPVRGTLPAVMAAARAGVRRVVVPLANASEAALVPGILVKAVDNLGRLIAFARGAGRLLDPPAERVLRSAPGPDLADVAGQEDGRRGLEVAAAGGHHLALFGPPGAGKTMLAERLPGLLPLLDDQAALEVTAVHSVAGVLPPDGPLIRRPPFQAPHHTTSAAALVGGGSGLARPGVLSLAHRGILFLDEAPLLSGAALDTLRQPLESGWVRLARTRGTTEYPARVQLVIAANPCACPTGALVCDCSSLARRRYLARISGPLLDRIDVQLTLRPVTPAQLLVDPTTAESSATVAARVGAARAAAAERWSGTGWSLNSQVPGADLRGAPWRLPAAVSRDLTRHLELGLLSARGFDRVLRVAWTLADLGGRTRPDPGDVREAIHLRLRSST